MINNKISERRFKRAVSILICISLLIMQSIYFTPETFAAGDPTLTISPTAWSSGSLPKNITITADSTYFTPGSVTPYLFLNGSNANATITNVSSTATKVTFTLGAGLANGTYDVVIVDPGINAGQSYDTGKNFTVGNPSITGSISLANGYSQQSVTITGVNTNFALNKTTIQILNGSGTDTGLAGSVTSVNTSTQELTFTVKAGLASGTYSVKATTTVGSDSEVVTGTGVLVVRSASSISLSKSQLTAGYDAADIVVTGTNTGFSSQTVVKILSGSTTTGKAGQAAVTNSTSLTFKAQTGLTAGTYTVEVKTGEVVEGTATLTVLAPSAELQSSGSSFTEIARGYTESKSLILTGTNTNFVEGTTSLKLLNSSGSDITGNYITGAVVSNSTSISFTLGTGLAAGIYTVRASTGNEVVSDTFNVYTPSIGSPILNTSVAVGTSIPEGYKKFKVDLVGTKTTFTKTANTVTIDGQTNMTETVSAEDDTHLSFYLKAGLSKGTYTIRVNDIMTTTFAVTGDAGISEVNPVPVIKGNTPETITITGINTHFTAATPLVKIINTDGSDVTGSTTSNISVLDDTTLTFSFTPSAATYTANTYGVKITTNDTAINETVQDNNILTFEDAGIKEITPNPVYLDELGSIQISIIGQNTNFSSSNTSVYIDDEEIDSGVTISSTTLITFTVPAGLSLGTRTVKVMEGSTEYTKTFTVASDVSSLNIENSTGTEITTYTAEEYGDPFNLKVIGVLAKGGNEDKTQSAKWEVISGTDVVSVSNTSGTKGKVTIKKAGTAAIKATYNDKSDTVNIIVDNVTPSSLEINSSSNIVYVGKTLNLSAKAVIKGIENTVTNKASWSSSDTSKATVGASTGVVTGVADGTVTITAEYDGVTAEKSITVYGIPGTPDGLTAGTATSSGVTLTWGSVAGAQGYKLYKDTSASGNFSSAVYSGANTEYTDSSLTAGTTYYYKVSAFNDGGESNKSSVVSAKIETEVVSTGGGGVGGGGLPAETTPVADEVITNTDGSETNVDADNDKAVTEYSGTMIAAKIQGTNKAVVIELPAVAVSTHEIVLDANAVNKLIENKAGLSVKTSGAALTIPSEVFESSASKELKLDIKLINDQERIALVSKLSASQKSDLQFIGQVAEFTITSQDKEITSFKNKIKLEFSLKNNNLTGKNTKRLGVYYLDEKNNKWIYVGGKYNKKTGVIEASTDHFTKFAVMEYNKKFDDVPANSWAKEYIEILAARHITSGVTDTMFDPAGKVTRAQFAAFIVRALDIPTGNYKGLFKDCVPGKWYTSYIEAAAEAGIVNGMGNAVFKPDAEITREQMAVLLMKAYSYKSKISIGEEAAKSTNNFADKGDIADWASIYVKGAQANGLISGMPDGTFNPKGNALREQVAKVIVKLLEITGDI